MHKFKYDDGSDGVTYETLEELLKLPTIEIREDGDSFYVNVIEDAPYYNVLYKVDKKTHKASYYGDKIGYMIDIHEKAKPVDPKTIKGVS